VLAASFEEQRGGCRRRRSAGHGGRSGARCSTDRRGPGPAADHHPGGQPVVEALTKRETADLYRLLVCAHVLATVKEAFAVAPALQSARILALRPSPPGAYGRVRLEVLLAARFERSQLAGIRSADADAGRVVEDAHSELISSPRGATHELQTLDLDQHADRAALIEVVDFEELLTA